MEEDSGSGMSSSHAHGSDISRTSESDGPRIGKETISDVGSLIFNALEQQYQEVNGIVPNDQPLYQLNNRRSGGAEMFLRGHANKPGNRRFIPPSALVDVLKNLPEQMRAHQEVFESVPPTPPAPHDLPRFG
jgi:hypothetical protein